MVSRLTEPATRLHTYADYDTYRDIQRRGNALKLAKVWARESNIRHIARYAETRLGEVRSVLCHGTRNGAELRWFRASFSNHPRVLGTDIALSAATFPDTIVWDFHDLDPAWERAWDLVYSNSWDHAREPERALRAWMRSLTPGGLLILEHSERHLPSRVSALDPFGATLRGLVRMLDQIDPDGCRVIEIVKLPEAGRSAVVARATGPDG